MRAVVLIRVLLAITVVACKLDSRLETDAGPPVDQPVDQPAPPRCDNTKPFGTPALIPELNTFPPPNDSFGARLSADELTVVFTRNVSALEQLGVMTATRPSIDEPFGFADVIAPVNSPLDDSNPMLDSSGLRLYLDSSRQPQAVGGIDIYVASRASVTDPFGAPQGVLAVDTQGSEIHPYVVEGGTAMFYSGVGDIYESKGGPGGFSAPSMHTELSEPGPEDGHPVLTEDGLVIYFSSDRLTGGAGLNIFRASRSDLGTAFGTPVLVSGIPSSPTWVSNDDCVLLVTAERGTGSEGIFIAKRPL